MLVKHLKHMRCADEAMGVNGSPREGMEREEKNLACWSAKGKALVTEDSVSRALRREVTL